MLDECINESLFVDMVKTLERYKFFLQQFKSDKNDVKIADDINAVDKKLEHWAANNLTLDKFSKLLTNKGNRRKDINISTSKSSIKTSELLNALKISNDKELQDGMTADNLNCSYCSLKFENIGELRLHCQTENHQKVIMSDEGKF